MQASEGTPEQHVNVETNQLNDSSNLLWLWQNSLFRQTTIAAAQGGRITVKSMTGHPADGVWDPETRTIRISTTVTGRYERARTLIFEICNAAVGFDDIYRQDRELARLNLHAHHDPYWQKIVEYRARVAELREAETVKLARQIAKEGRRKQGWPPEMDDLDQFFTGDDRSTFDEAKYLDTQERLGHTNLHRARIYGFQQETWVAEQLRPTVFDNTPEAEKYAYFLNK